MTIRTNRPPAALEKNEPVVADKTIIEQTGKKRVQILIDGKMLVLRSEGNIYTHWEDEG